tara:strand:+ start:438 stop:824 length:387 start_codon:yes stop_codon:yes gene_type:complete
MMNAKQSKYLAVCEGLMVISIVCAALCVFIGCQTNGFQYLPDGELASPGAMRNAAATARAEADALDAMADRQNQGIANIIGVVDKGAEMMGAPAVVGGLLGAVSTLFVPPPGTRKKQEKLVEEAKKKK